MNSPIEFSSIFSQLRIGSAAWLQFQHLDRSNIRDARPPPRKPVSHWTCHTHQQFSTACLELFHSLQSTTATTQYPHRTRVPEWTQDFTRDHIEKRVFALTSFLCSQFVCFMTSASGFRFRIPESAKPRKVERLTRERPRFGVSSQYTRN